MDSLGSFRRFWVHRWFVALLSAVGALAVLLGMALIPPRFASTAVIRVVPQAGTINSQDLDTAVSWYAALGQVPDIQTLAGKSVNPPLNRKQIEEQSTVEPGSGPGEISVVGTSRQADVAEDVATAMSTVILGSAASNPNYQLGRTTLQLLVPADRAEPAGPGGVRTSIAVFLLLFVILATLVGFGGSRVNWRLSPDATKQLSESLGIPSYRLAKTAREIRGGSVSAAAFVSGHLRLGPVAVVTVPGARSDSNPTEVLQAALLQIGHQVDLAAHANSVVPGPLLYGIVGDGSTIRAEAFLLGMPVLLAVPRGTRSWRVSALVRDLHALGVPILAILVIGKDARGQDGNQITPASAAPLGIAPQRSEDQGLLTYPTPGPGHD